MSNLLGTLAKNRTRTIVLAILLGLFISAIAGMDTDDWFITILRGLSLGMIIFLVASGLSLIFGLMDVLNLAHGELFMLGAYIGWTVFIRPDTVVDLLPLFLFFAIGFVMLPLWRNLWGRWALPTAARYVLIWGSLALGAVVVVASASHVPFAKWDPEVFSESPATNSLSFSQGNLVLTPVEADLSAVLLPALGTLISGVLLAFAIAGFRSGKEKATGMRGVRPRTLLYVALMVMIGIVFMLGNDPITDALFALDSTLRFFLAMGIAFGVGILLGSVIEITLIRPLYDRPIYQLMITLGLGFIIIEVVQAIWGRPEFTMPKSALFNGSGDGCPAMTVSDLLQHQCSTMIILDARIRTYNEIFIIIVGIIVLISVWLLLQRTRLGMIIRAGVQDGEMVEALGINVRRVFTLVFALGVALAMFGGVLAAPSMGLSVTMGTRLLLLALIALAIGGLTSFPGAAAGAILVGLVQQFIIKYGQLGIQIPFVDELFKPSPPLVPASTVFLMIVVLLVLPKGLFGRSE